MDFDYIIVQAGGKGTRLEHLTENKPKALVPVENLPMLFHLFRKFPEKRFIIIADYKKDIMRKYLECFADVKYQLVEAKGSGTCSGVKQALKFVPENMPFMLIWSDLILPESFTIPKNKGNYIGISQTFSCRWSYKKGKFIEEPSEEFGVAGMFVFEDSAIISGVPESGELVRWMQGQDIIFEETGLAGTKEFGLISEYEKLGKEKCRPFNKITEKGNIIIKEGIDSQGKDLASLEVEWYEEAKLKGVKNIPEIYSTGPIHMEKISGKNIYEYRALPQEEKLELLKSLVCALNELHNMNKMSVDLFSVREAYYNKTISRLQKVRDLIPYSNNPTITVNGRECRNIYFYKHDLEKKLENLDYKDFVFIHGDCTFSNMMLRENREPVFIDPRGYFGFTKLYGDENYDWAKLYYSIVGNYDRFNLKDFRLKISEDGIKLDIESNNWESLEQDFFKLSGTNPETIKLIHAVIWLSLTTYAWQDYDSICGAFYNGLFYLEDIFNGTF